MQTGVISSSDHHFNNLLSSTHTHAHTPLYGEGHPLNFLYDTTADAIKTWKTEICEYAQELNGLT